MYTEEQLEKMATDELRAIVKAIELRVGCEVLRGRNRAMLIETILEDQEEKGGSALECASG